LENLNGLEESFVEKPLKNLNRNLFEMMKNFSLNSKFLKLLSEKELKKKSLKDQGKEYERLKKKLKG